MSQRTLDRDICLSIVIPCYNEEDVLPLLAERLARAAGQWPIQYEVILVDDGSSDGTWKAMRGLQARSGPWCLVRLARHFGHQSALWTGLGHARGDLIAVLDADLQDPPEILPRFFHEWARGSDVVYGVRRRRKEHFLKRAAYASFYRLLNLCSEIPIPLDSGDFCVMDRRVVQAMLQTTEQEPFVRGLRAWVGFRQTAVEYDRGSRAAGRAKYRLPQLLGLAASGIFGFSTRPLRLASYLGLGVTSCSFLGAVLALLHGLFGGQSAWLGRQPAPGYSALVIAILLLGGVQLICLGILGEYIGRIHANSKGRPQSVVSERYGFEPRHAASLGQSAA
jgi:dolichol-phosphate mannosyltransferase